MGPNGPLAGVRLLAFTTGAAGPTVAKQLAEFGAQVINIESRRHPDTHRGGANQARWNVSPTYIKLHRNKLSFTVNLTTEAGRELVARLVRVSDVVLDNFSLGVMGRWGLDYENLRRLRPDIIAISLKGLGSTGPHAPYVTWGPNLTALFGLTHLWNHPDASLPTAEARAQHPDFMSGVCGAFAVMAALIHRQKTGEGQFIDGAQVEAGASLLGPLYMEYTLNGNPPQPRGNQHVAAAPHGAYRCRGDDRWCTIAVYTDGDWARCRRALGDPPWAADARFQTLLGRRRHRAELDGLVESWTEQRDAYEVMRLLQAAGVEAGVVQDVEDQFERDEQYRARGFLVELQEPELGPLVTEGVPIHLSETPGAVHTHAPLLGEHTEQLCRDVLGLSAEEIGYLTEQKVLY